ncbi:Hypothetical_protein [Hexamita inflata]|uniref:Hypothetical_protein n=1 Tax=Hexamita inflata TaxID=28002 RepID=A0AA86NJ09_9EUKA|nr:Hypothetical protein HINF_LOCUS8439 [Hexamita inflata]
MQVFLRLCIAIFFIIIIVVQNLVQENEIVLIDRMQIRCNLLVNLPVKLVYLDNQLSGAVNITDYFVFKQKHNLITELELGCIVGAGENIADYVIQVLWRRFQGFRS